MPLLDSGSVDILIFMKLLLLWGILKRSCARKNFSGRNEDLVF